MPDAWRKDRPTHQRADNVGQKQVGNRFELIALCGVPSDADTQFPQVLHRAPHFGARGTQLLGDAGAADDQRRIVAQQPNDMAKPGVR